jgi:hemoglobin
VRKIVEYFNIYVGREMRSLKTVFLISMPISMEEDTLYQKLGAANLQLLVERFYDLVFTDERIASLFKTDKELIKEKQFLFLTQFLGGPPLYSQRYGHPQLRARHLPHPISDEDAVAWLQCMSAAITSLPIPQETKDELFKRFIPTAMFMVNQQDSNEV